jgi:hypothetical protein
MSTGIHQLNPPPEVKMRRTSNDAEKRINVNTVILLALTATMGIVGYFCKHTLERLEANMMPRQEIEIQIQGIRTQNMKLDLDMAEFRTRIYKLELDYVRMTKQTP